MTAPIIPALSVPCPRCKAAKGARCTTPEGRYVGAHLIRRRYAERGWEQLEMFAGEELKAQGMGYALNGATAWHNAARAWVRALPAGAVITSEDVTAAVGLPRGDRATNRNNAVGAAMNALQRAGLIAGTGRHVRSRRPSSHAALIAEWTRTATHTKGPGDG